MDWKGDQFDLIVGSQGHEWNADGNDGTQQHYIVVSNSCCGDFIPNPVPDSVLWP